MLSLQALLTKNHYCLHQQHNNSIIIIIQNGVMVSKQSEQAQELHISVETSD